ncbi:MAG: hypothetical protein O3A87_01145 [Verrucomicrobia bacterium]|nr:hypothetical protein [Verrucomicrobiota bacterium]
MKSGAWLFLLSSTVLLIAVSVLAYAFLPDNKHMLLPAFGGVLFGLLLLLIYRVTSSSARCPLCAGPVLLSQHCQRNRNAKPLFGSYRFRVARDIALVGTFRCPYCGEDTLCMPRKRPRHS